MFFLQMSGFPGSGKSTLARQIAKSTGAIIIDHDIVKSAMLEVWDSNTDTNVTGSISYHIEWALIDFHLSLGHSVIHDSPCFYTETLEKGTEVSKKHNAKFKYVECYLNDIKEIDDRLKKRVRMISQFKDVSTDEKSQEAYKKWIDNSKRPADIEYLVVDSAQPLDSYINKVIEYINSP